MHRVKADLLVPAQLLVTLCCYSWEWGSAIGLPKEVVIPDLKGLFAGGCTRKGRRLLHCEPVEVHGKYVVHKRFVCPAVLNDLDENGW